MAINTNGLTTVARLKTFMGITAATHDTLLERIVNGVSDFVEDYCNRVFRKTAYTNEVYDGTGRQRLQLKHYPISAVTLERRDTPQNVSSWSSIDSEEYFVETATGMLIYYSGIFADLPQIYRISYTAGYAFDNVTPGATLESVGLGDLEIAVWKLCARIFNNREGSGGSILSETIGNFSVTYGGFLSNSVIADPEVKGVLDRYIKPAFG